MVEFPPKYHPMLFNTEMVRAILAGKKTETRRPVKHNLVGAVSPWEEGDRLWVREAFHYGYDRLKGEGCYFYRADFNADHPMIKWTPSIHMPRKACRLILEVDAVHKQWLCNVTEEQAIKEGFASREEFMATFQEIYKPIPERERLVWVIQFHIAEKKQYDKPFIHQGGSPE